MKSGGGKCLGGLGGGEVFAHGREVGLRFTALIECFFEIGGGIGGFISRSIDTSNGHPCLGQNIACDAGTIGDDFTEEVECFSGASSCG